MAWSPQSFPVSKVEKWRARNKWRHRCSSTSGLVVLWGAGVRLGCLGPPLQSPDPSSQPLTLQQDLLWDQQRLRWPHISQGFETAAEQDQVPPGVPTPALCSPAACPRPATVPFQIPSICLLPTDHSLSVNIGEPFGHPGAGFSSLVIKMS